MSFIFNQRLAVVIKCQMCRKCVNMVKVVLFVQTENN